MPATPYPSLFSEIELAGRRLRNRVCLCATVTNFARDNRITEPWRNFLIERAKGGTGMLVTEIIAVDSEAIAQSSTVTGFDDTNDDAFRAIARDVHGEGAALVGQLWHPGRQQLWHPTKAPIGVSDLPDPYSWTVPHVMSTAEARRVVEAYVQTARRLARCGFAGVELHGAHGYLIMQFLSPASNTRDDAYGGDLERRTRFVREIAAGIRRHCGPGFIIGLKMPADEGAWRCRSRRGGTDNRAARGHRGFRLFRLRTGQFQPQSRDPCAGSLLPARPFHRPAQTHAKRRWRVPVMALGRIGTPDLAERVIADGHGDLVGMTRALITDAAWADKARIGRAEDIRPCVYDNFSWGEVHLGKPVAEHHNPYLGKLGEAHRLPEAADHVGRVLVVGAGPAGLEAAWVAAARGHGVTVFSASENLGGALRLEAGLPGRSEMARIIDHQRHMGERYGVEYVFNRRADAEMIRRFDPDAVVLATGSEQRLPAGLSEGPGLISARVYAAMGGEAPRGGTVVLVDEDHGAATYGVADLLAERFERVVLVTSRPRIAGAVNHCSAIGVFRRLYGAGVEIRPSLETRSLVGGRLTLVNVFSGAEESIDDVDLVVYATPRLARDSLAAVLEYMEVHLIGDCRSPRNLLAAIQGGHALGEAL